MRLELLLICGLLALSACSSGESPEKYQGRPETKKLEASSIVGYDGKAMRKGVDSSLDKVDARSGELDKALESAGE